MILAKQFRTDSVDLTRIYRGFRGYISIDMNLTFEI